MGEQLRILEGATFCICDELGDLHGDVEGLFSEDTRFLSRLRLTVNGKRPLLLSSDKIEYFSAAFFMRNPLVNGLPPDALSIRRERFVGDGLQDSFLVQNQSMERVEFDLELEIGTDFADIFAVKDYDFALGDPLHAKPLPPLRPGVYNAERNQFLIADDGDLPLKTQVVLSQRGEVRDSSVRFRLALEPRERWDLQVEVIPLPDGEEVAPRFVELRFGEEVGRVRRPGSSAYRSCVRVGMR
jgi:glycogen debranching enzyme